MPVRAILLDKDGTLVDIQATLGPATCDVLRHLGGSDAMIARLAELTHVDLTAKRLLPGCPVISEATGVYGRIWAQALGLPYTEDFAREIDRLFLGATVTHLQPIADPREILGDLAPNYLLGIMTNDAEANTRAQMEKLGLDAFVEFVAGYDSGLGQKPDATPVLAFAAAMGVAPGEVAVVGDSPHDMIAARAAGAIAVGVLSGPNGADVLSPHAGVLLPSIAKLDDWLCSLGPRG